MQAEYAVTLGVSLIGAGALVLGPILLFLVKLRHENQLDHAKVVTSVDVLALQVAELTKLTVEATAELKAHTKWEETQKYASMDQIETLIQSVRNVQSDVADVQSDVADVRAAQ